METWLAFIVGIFVGGLTAIVGISTIIISRDQDRR